MPFVARLRSSISVLWQNFDDVGFQIEIEKSDQPRGEENDADTTPVRSDFYEFDFCDVIGSFRIVSRRISHDEKHAADRGHDQNPSAG